MTIFKKNKGAIIQMKITIFIISKNLLYEILLFHFKTYFAFDVFVDMCIRDVSTKANK